MAYELRSLRRQKVKYDHANTNTPLVYQLFVDGVKVTPTSATITIYGPGDDVDSATPLVNGAAMTVSGTLMEYSVDTTTEASWPIDTGYKAIIVVTYSATTYPTIVVFDVVRYILRQTLGRDQLVDRDDAILSGEHAEGADFEGLINAAYDELQIFLEAKAIDSGYVIENMILDHGKLSTCVRLYVLEMYFREKENEDKADHYKERFDVIWSAFLSSVRFDGSQGGDEDDQDQTRIRFTRLVT